MTQSNTTPKKSLSYASSGVDINKADQMKDGLKESLNHNSSRVLNSIGAFSSLFDISNLPNIKHPVLCLKMEEPGSKQLLAAKHGRLSSIGDDLVNHLINDTIMNGGAPLAILDTIVCGNLEPELVSSLISSMSKAAKSQDCYLVGGETSEQPRVIDDGTYILSAACVGIVDKSKIITGENIAPGQQIFAVASNGPHTNGYTLIRSLIDQQPEILTKSCNGETFLDAILMPHLCYNTPLQKIFQKTSLSGLAHITGGGVADNTKRILSSGVNAKIDLSLIKIPEVFSMIKTAGNVTREDMFRTFNCGIGMVFVGEESDCTIASDIFSKHGIDSYQIGEIADGNNAIDTSNELSF